jgi:hypothetical protein
LAGAPAEGRHPAQHQQDAGGREERLAQFREADARVCLQLERE